MGERVEFTMNAIRPVTAVTLFGYRPENFKGMVGITLSVGERNIETTIDSGVFSMVVDIPESATGLLDVAISADRTQQPPSNKNKDERDLSVIIDRFELTHPPET